MLWITQKASGIDLIRISILKSAQVIPATTFDGAEAWVEHPYKEGVALVGDAAAASDPSWGQGLASTLRDVRLLRDHLLKTEDWDAAGHSYATEHDSHAEIMHTVIGWYTEFYLATGAAADARRARALPLIAEDPTRQPDTLFCGPDQALNENDRKRFFAEGELARDFADTWKSEKPNDECER